MGGRPGWPQAGVFVRPLLLLAAGAAAGAAAWWMLMQEARFGPGRTGARDEAITPADRLALEHALSAARDPRRGIVH